MKKFWVIMTMLFAFTLTATQAEAKKFGGGKSFGKSFQTAPSQPKKVSPDSTASKQQAAQTSPSKGGMMKGLLGGLLAGGLIAALFGGAFEGLQIMDILIMAVIAFVVFRLFKGMMQAKASSMQPQPAYAGNQTRQSVDAGFSNRGSDASFTESSSNGFTGDDDVPFNLPAGFDINNFLSGAREHFRTIQQAWNENDLAAIKEYVSEELFGHLEAERAALSGNQHTEVMFVDAELVRADQAFGVAELSIKFSGRYRDTVEGVEEAITDIWHLQRDTTADNAPWLIVGIETP